MVGRVRDDIEQSRPILSKSEFALPGVHEDTHDIMPSRDCGARQVIQDYGNCSGNPAGS
jgi:hypothetical protein